VDSHAYFLRAQEAPDETVMALVRADLEAAGLPAKEAALLKYVEQVTRHAEKTTPADVQRLRELGWTDEQIGEAVYITALFAFFNRVADAFGVPAMGYLNRGQLTP
jgi:uncharacterized peroxidase-related enzyme